MQIIPILIGGVALIALAARLHQIYLRFTFENYPILPCIVALNDTYFIQGIYWTDKLGKYILGTYNPEEARTFRTKEDYKEALAIARQWGHKSARWCVPIRKISSNERRHQD